MRLLPGCPRHFEPLMHDAWYQCGCPPAHVPDSAPRRFIRSRAKGSRLPHGCIFVGRPSRFGNPFRIGDTVTVTGRLAYGNRDVIHTFVETMPMTRTMALTFYARHLAATPGLLADARDSLAGHDVACYCALHEPCHCDILLAVANPDLWPT